MLDSSTIDNKRETRPPHARLNEYKSRHLYTLAQYLELNVHRMYGVAYSPDTNPDYLSGLIRSTYTAQEIDDANAAVVKTYQHGKGYYRKGRPAGSKNKPKHSDVYPPWPSREQPASSTVTIDATAVQPEPVTLPALPSPVSEPVTIDVWRLAMLEAQISAVVRDILADRERNESEHRAFDTRIGYAHDRIKELDRTTDRLWETVNAIKDNRPTIIELSRPDMPSVNIGIAHKMFPTLLKMCAARQRSGYGLNIWIHGPAGTGKSTAAEKVAEALSLPFLCTGSLNAPHEVLGFNNAHKYVSTAFRQAWEHGGVYCLDEADGSSPQAMLALNGALAGSLCAFPDAIVKRHRDFIFIATANTTGSGANVEYSGRFKMDAASLNRFVMLHWPIDEALEASFCANQDWVRRVRQVRANLAKHSIKAQMITPRAVLYGEALLAAGLSQAEVERAVLQGSMTDAQWAMVK